MASRNVNAFFATIVLLGALFLGCNLAVDDCLDRGGCWDAVENRCEFDDPSACHIE